VKRENKNSNQKEKVNQIS